ncbi:hypothetical protein BDZ94DRAFT_1257899 [Collybia nuda]|uniref:Uncharacterized protein n=1 Tax=Collybia nuda TaxID=64659 RepID=A0A9P6CKP1_9AGAR|nr:hypothetical protein BDZ94DRAFT_1257899 [Collybia nuda]
MFIPQFLLTALPLISSYYPKVPEHHSPRTIVSLRIEGQHQTLFEGYVYTWPHDVDPEHGGKHRCDGTNADRNPKPGPTVTGTLDNAASRNGFT